MSRQPEDDSKQQSEMLMEETFMKQETLQLLDEENLNKNMRATKKALTLLLWEKKLTNQLLFRQPLCQIHLSQQQILFYNKPRLNKRRLCDERRDKRDRASNSHTLTWASS